MFYYDYSAGLALFFISIIIFVIGLIFGALFLFLSNRFRNSIFYGGIIIQLSLSVLMFSSYGTFILKSNKKYSDHISPNEHKNGLVEIFYLNGNIKERAEIKNNKFNGIYEKYNWEGKLVEQGNYINSFKNGEWKIKRNAKSKWNFRNYNMGKKTGQWIYLHYNGRNKKDVTYIGNDSIVNNTWDYKGKEMVVDGNGIHLDYFHNLNPKKITPFKNGKINGLVLKLNENGDTIQQKVFINNKER